MKEWVSEALKINEMSEQALSSAILALSLTSWASYSGFLGSLPWIDDNGNKMTYFNSFCETPKNKHNIVY